MTYCLKCHKNTENVDSRVLKMVEQCYYQNMLYVVVKKQDLWKNEKQMLLLSSLKTPLSNIPLLGKIFF